MLVQSKGITSHDRALRIIIIGVVLAHFIFLLAITLSFKKKMNEKMIERLVVKTVQLQPKPANIPPKVKSEAIAEIETLPAKLEIASEVKDETIEIPIENPVSTDSNIGESIEEIKKENFQKKEKPLDYPPSTKKPDVKKKIEPKKTIPTEKKSSINEAKQIKKATHPPVPKKEVQPKAQKEKVLPQKTKTDQAKAKYDQQKAKDEAAQKAAAQREAAKAKAAKEEDNRAKERAKKAEEARARKQKLLSTAQKSISNVAGGKESLVGLSDFASSSAVIPAQIENLQVEALIVDARTEQMNPQEIGYYGELASRLKLKLRLPEHGEVKIKLTLERSGRFLKVVIVSSASSKNREYIEKTLPKLTYPGFGNNFGQSSEYTFVIALSNEI